MTQQNAIQIFEGNQVRVAWNEEEEKYYFSIVDVVQILTEQPTPRKASTYWAVLKKRLKEEGADELLTNCKQLKMPAAHPYQHPHQGVERHEYRRIQTV